MKKRKFTADAWWGDKGERTKVIGSKRHARVSTILETYKMMLIYNNAHGITMCNDERSMDTTYVTADLYRAPPP